MKYLLLANGVTEAGLIKLEAEVNKAAAQGYKFVTAYGSNGVDAVNYVWMAIEVDK